MAQQSICGDGNVQVSIGSVSHGVVFVGSDAHLYASAAQFPAHDLSRRYLRMLAVIAAPVTNAAGDDRPTGDSLDVWGE